MGYYKQLEIAQQTEEAHRPKPATHHVAWSTVTYSPEDASKIVTHFPTRRERLNLQRVMKREQRRETLAIVAWAVVGLTITGALLALSIVTLMELL